MRITLILIIFALSIVRVNAQTDSSKGVLMVAGGDAYHAKINLTTKIKDERYCSDGTIRYLLLFKFTNAGGETVLLDRFRPVVTRYMVSRDAPAAAMQKYEANAHILIARDERDDYQPGLDESNFTALSVGKSYEVEKELILSLNSDKGTSLRFGTHMLQVLVPTWYHPNVSNIEWRKKWRDKGYLWSDPIKSEPMSFSIRNGRVRSECQ